MHKAESMHDADIAIVGAGIVGLSTAYQLSRRAPGLSLRVLDKETEPAAHQTGRNSGVIHSGIYYPPGSLKSLTCRAGRQALIEFCQEQALPHEICGKLIVATNQPELEQLVRIRERGRQNGVEVRELERDELLKFEPHAAGLRALHVPQAGIVDYRAVCRRLVECIGQATDCHLIFSAEVCAFSARSGRVVVHSRAGEFSVRHVVNCAGLHSDHVTRMTGEMPEVRIIPFKGEYFALRPGARRLVRHLIYPVPDPRFPFLGVHFTRGIDGSRECGPNAVLAGGREAYGKFALIPGELMETLLYPGFVRLAAKHWRTGLAEAWRSVSKAAFVAALQRLVPAVTAHDLIRVPAGIRAQAVAPNGSLVDDFLFQDRDWVTSVQNAPSPAATASLEIGRLIAERVLAKLA
jgi:L-2-hydroxyglutarate oxidase